MATVNDLSKTIYKIAEGKDKDRLTKEIELRKSGTWNTTIISNGEASILGKCSKNEGIDVRVLELSDIVWAENAEHSDLVKELANKNYGVFGHSFAEKLIQIPIEELKNRFENEKEEFIEKVKEKGITDSKLQRTSAKNAIVILTAKLIN
ncbi:Superfamily II helicase [Clostridioides difficile]|nr:Superfamily II helicase [Clostridioides difficile]AXU33481.1 Superfamily II helicase [Clostridioides difficile]AXU37267.1 Superfamily II helicase [Clostridioides difficile]SJU85742.1 Superfamily II helicase and inactivated derivatives [Clostridioides difficile]SJV20862.1 Superfamily II helicase and inactivated derivatives [Clostridioides difficile]